MLLLLYLGSESSALIHLYLKTLIRRQCLRHLAIIGTLAVGVHTVGKKLDVIIPLWQERQIHIHLTRGPVGYSTDIPHITLAACSDYVFAHLRIQHPCLVPYCRYGGDEIG